MASAKPVVTYRGLASNPLQATVLPLRPLWFTFAINSILYALILSPLMCSPFALRRFVRVRRGLCPKCAYPMGESGVCRECGGDALKRRILVAGVFLLAGVVVNVAVAWECALTSFDAEIERAFGVYDSMIWQVDRISRTGAVVFVSVRMRSRFAAQRTASLKSDIRPSAVRSGSSSVSESMRSSRSWKSFGPKSSSPVASTAALSTESRLNSTGLASPERRAAF